MFSRVPRNGCPWGEALEWTGAPWPHIPVVCGTALEVEGGQLAATCGVLSPSEEVTGCVPVLRPLWNSLSHPVSRMRDAVEGRGEEGGARVAWLSPCFPPSPP